MVHNMVLDNREQEQLNISISKLKKLFKLKSLFSLLLQQDAITKTAGTNIAASGPLARLKESSPNLMLSTSQKPKPVAELPVITQTQPDQLVDPQLVAQGYSLLKPKILDFIRYVHIISEKVSASNEILHCQAELIQFIQFEQKRLEQTSKDQYEEEYLCYLFENVLPFIIIYYDKYLSPNSVAVQQHISDDEERKDFNTIKQFADVLANKLSIFHGTVNKYHADRIYKFLSYFPEKLMENISQMSEVIEKENLISKTSQLGRGNEIALQNPQPSPQNTEKDRMRVIYKILGVQQSKSTQQQQ